MLSDNWMLYSSLGVLASQNSNVPIAPITLLLAQSHHPITIKLVPSNDSLDIIE